MSRGPREKLARCSRYPEVPTERVRPLRLVVNQRVLAERNHAVAPVGVWVESNQNQWQEAGQSTAVVSAFYVEQELKKQQKEKQENLIRFQHEVKRRVNQHARMRKKQQLLKSYNAAEKEGIRVQQSLNAAGHLTLKRNTCVYRNNAALAIHSPGSPGVPALQNSSNVTEDVNEEDVNEENIELTSNLFQQQAVELGKTIEQVRHRLAACKTMQDTDMMSELPGGICKVSPIRDNSVSRRSPLCLPDDSEECLLEGHHDLTAELHSPTLVSCPAGNENGVPFANETGKHTVIMMKITATSTKICNRFLKEPYPAGSVPAVSTDFRAALVLRPGVHREEIKKQRENQYLKYRRLFMNIEREQVKETRRQKEQENKIAEIKKEKELHRNGEEQRLLRLSKLKEPCIGVREQRMLARLKLEEQKLKVTEKKKQKIKEHVRIPSACSGEIHTT